MAICACVGALSTVLGSCLGQYYSQLEYWRTVSVLLREGLCSTALNVFISSFLGARGEFVRAGVHTHTHRKAYKGNGQRRLKLTMLRAHDEEVTEMKSKGKGRSTTADLSREWYGWVREELKGEKVWCTSLWEGGRA